jgi:hypothetical protein
MQHATCNLQHATNKTQHINHTDVGVGDDRVQAETKYQQAKEWLEQGLSPDEYDDMMGATAIVKAAMRGNTKMIEFVPCAAIPPCHAMRFHAMRFIRAMQCMGYLVKFCFVVWYNFNPISAFVWDSPVANAKQQKHRDQKKIFFFFFFIEACNTVAS